MITLPKLRMQWRGKGITRKPTELIDFVRLAIFYFAWIDFYGMK